MTEERWESASRRVIPHSKSLTPETQIANPARGSWLWTHSVRPRRAHLSSSFWKDLAKTG